MGWIRYLNHWLCHAALTGLAATLFSAPAMALECNTFVSESLTLVSDISCSNAGDVGLTVAAGASGITIDLNGHSVTGARKERSIGVLVDAGASNITVVNGTIASFERGVVISNSTGVVVSGLAVRNNRRDGVTVRNSSDVTVAGNELNGNTNGLVGSDTGNLTVMGNTGEKNSNVGFDITGGIDIDLTNNESLKGAQRAAFRIVGPATVSLTANRALGYRGFGYQFADAPTVSDGGGNSARGKKRNACFPDPCPLELR